MVDGNAIHVTLAFIVTERRGNQMASLVDMFGERPQARIIQAMIRDPNHKFKKYELELISGVSRPTLLKVLPKMVKAGIIKESWHYDNNDDPRRQRYSLPNNRVTEITRELMKELRKLDNG